jgi:hypothetical protein
MEDGARGLDGEVSIVARVRETDFDDKNNAVLGRVRLSIVGRRRRVDRRCHMEKRRRGAACKKGAI